MLATKIITAAVILLSVIFRAAMDFVWKDKRTRRYRYARNGFVLAAILGAILNVIVLAVDEVKKQSKSEAERKQQQHFENISLGGLSPEIWILLYNNNKLVCPRTDDMFPGTNLDLQMISQTGVGPGEMLCILVLNPFEFPIYDLGITLFKSTPDNDNLTSLTAKSEEFEKTPLLYPHEQKLFMHTANSNLLSRMFEFTVRTKRGNSMHTIGFSLVSNQCGLAPV